MSDSVVVNVISPQTTSITVNDTGESIYINPLTLNQGIINHSVTHQSGGSDELFHNLLGGLQGGSSGNYYHLTSGQYANLVTGAVIRPSDTGVFYPNSNPSGFITGVNLSGYVTGDVVRPSQTGNFITTSQTGAFYAASNPSGFITGVNLSAYVTGAVVRPSETGAFYAASNPSGFITGVDLSAYVTGLVVRPSETGNFITSSQTGNFYSSSNPSGFVTGSVVRPYETGSFITNSQTGVFYPTSNPSGFALTVSPARTTLTGDGATSIYAISGAGSLTNPSALIVATDGALQEPGVDYSVSGGYITFTSPLVSGAKSVVVSPTNTVQVLDMIPSDGSVTSTKLASGLSISSPTLTNAVIGGSTTFSTSGAATALNTSLGTRRVRRATIATRTSSSIIADDTLVLSVISGVSYRIKIHALTKNSTATVGMVLLLQHPGITATTSTEAVGHFTNNGGNAIVTPSTSTTLTNIVNQNGQNLSTIAEVIITPTASGNVTVMWGARVPAGVETAGLNANSYMEITEIG